MFTLNVYTELTDKTYQILPSESTAASHLSNLLARLILAGPLAGSNLSGRVSLIGTVRGTEHFNSRDAPFIQHKFEDMS